MARSHSFASRVGWAISAAGFAAGAAGLLISTGPKDGRQRSAIAPGEAVSALRRDLDSVSAENMQLRAELERLAAEPRGGRPNEPALTAQTSPRADGSVDPQTAESFRGQAGRFRDDLARSLAGDGAARERAYETLMELLRAGPDAFPALRDAYLSATDPSLRTVMVRALVRGKGNEVAEFVAAELATESDAGTRRALAVHAADLATPDSAPLLAEPLLQILRSTDDGETRLAAIRALRYASGAEIDEALLSAGSDPSEDVRMVAVQLLASRPERRERLRRLVEADTSARVRQFGRCQILLTE